MTAFEIFLYAIAVLTVLWLRAEPTPAPLPVVDDLPELAELLAEAEALTARPVPAVAATVAAPVAIARIEVEAPAKPIAKMTSQELRKECSKATPPIAWRNAHGKGKHLRKEEMLKALA